MEYEANAKGFKSILKKSVHFNNNRFRDVLMNITMLSNESTLSMFVDNLDEFAMLLETQSPAVTAFFENCFLHTEFCKSVSNADWKTGIKYEIYTKI